MIQASSKGSRARSKRLLRELAIGMVVIGVSLALVACGSSSSSSSSSGGSSSSSSSSSLPGKGKPPLTLGTKDFTEEFILGQLYRQVLVHDGYTVNYKENIGATEVVDKALTSGQIDAYPEYTGESVATVFNITTPVTSAQQEYQLAQKAYAKRGQAMSQMTPFFDKDAIATLKTYATQHGLKTMT